MALYEIEKNSSGVPTGNYKHVAGRGRAEYGASTVRTGTYIIDEITPGGALWKTFTFSDPMPDGDYMVDFSFPATASIYAQAYEKNAENVKVSFRNISTNDTFTNVVVNYTCYKLYTDTEYNNILAAMPSDASASNKVITRSTIGVNSSASHRIPSDVTDGQALAEAIWGMIKTDGSPESGVMPVMYEAHDYGMVVYGYLWEGTFKWCVFTFFTLASGSNIIRAKVNTATDVVTIYTS
jgi:hypothetical protein